MNPWLVRNCLLPIHERLLGRRTFRAYRELMRTQWQDRRQLEELQLLKLRKLISVMLRELPAYAELSGLDADWLPESLDDLSKLPLLDKATISARREQLTNRSVPGGPIRYNTGGSSGQPLIFYLDKRRQAYDKAARMRAHKWWGVDVGQREAYIWGSQNVRDWLTNEMLLSAFDLSAETVGRFVQRLRRFRPKCLFGYPSSITVMCKLAAAAGLDLRSIGVRVVFCTAEVLYDDQRRVISEAFAAPVANGYGSREGGFIAHECPQGRMHITAESVIVECLKGDRPAGPGQDGQIVITHLDNYAMPFIRYKTGDIGQLSSDACPCGRGLPLMQVVKGRATDFVISPDARWVHGLALIYVVRDIPGVNEYQIVQRDVDSILVRLVVDEAFPADGRDRICRGISKRLGPEVRVDVEQVASIPRDPSGKFRYVVSQVARDREASL